MDRIRTPLFLSQGANDVRVVQSESDQIVEALRARGVPVEYTVMEDEGHSFDNPDNAIALYKAAERFLGKHLGAKPDGVRAAKPDGVQERTEILTVSRH